MADPNRRFRLAAITLPLLFLAMSGLARATTILVDTTSGGSVGAKCSLHDAIQASNTGFAVNGCPAGTGTDKIMFTVTGTITIGATLVISGNSIAIDGPAIGGVTIDGGNARRILDVESNVLALKNLTFAHGAAIQGGAIFVGSGSLEIANCTFNNNPVTGTLVAQALGGAIYVNTAGTIDIINSTFANNAAVHGPNPTHSSGTDSSGGAIFNANASAVVEITNSTFSGNSA